MYFTYIFDSLPHLFLSLIIRSDKLYFQADSSRSILEDILIFFQEEILNLLSKSLLRNAFWKECLLLELGAMDVIS